MIFSGKKMHDLGTVKIENKKLIYFGSIFLEQKLKLQTVFVKKTQLYTYIHSTKES